METNPTLTDIILSHGTFAVYDVEMGGTVVREYTIDEIDYVQVSFPKSPDVVYTYLKGA